MRTFVAFATLVLFLSPAIIAQEAEVDVKELLTEFGQRVDTDGVNIMLVHLNDFTTDYFFTAPSKYALRAQARQRTMFYVTGSAVDTHDVRLDFELRQSNPQGHRLFTGQTINIQNFEEGSVVGGGEEFSGIVAFDADWRVPGKLVIANGDHVFSFEFNRNTLAKLGGS